MDYNRVEIAVAIFACGMFAGALAVRYGINFGVRMVYKIKEDVPLFEDTEPTTQDSTGD
jgi:hypothetical protein